MCLVSWLPSRPRVAREEQQRGQRRTAPHEHYMCPFQMQEEPSKGQAGWGVSNGKSASVPITHVVRSQPPLTLVPKNYDALV